MAGGIQESGVRCSMSAIVAQNWLLSRLQTLGRQSWAEAMAEERVLCAANAFPKDTAGRARRGRREGSILRSRACKPHVMPRLPRGNDRHVHGSRLPLQFDAPAVAAAVHHSALPPAVASRRHTAGLLKQVRPQPIARILRPNLPRQNISMIRRGGGQQEIVRDLASGEIYTWDRKQGYFDYEMPALVPSLRLFMRGSGRVGEVGIRRDQKYLFTAGGRR